MSYHVKIDRDNGEEATAQISTKWTFLMILIIIKKQSVKFTKRNVQKENHK